MKRLLAVLLIMCMAVSVCACGENSDKTDSLTGQKKPVVSTTYPEGTYMGVLYDVFTCETDNGTEYYGEFKIAEPLYVSANEFQKIQKLKTGDSYTFGDGTVMYFYKWDEFIAGYDCYMFTPLGNYVYDDPEYMIGVGKNKHNCLKDELVYLVSERNIEGDKIKVYYSDADDNNEIFPVSFDINKDIKKVNLRMDEGCSVYIYNNALGFCEEYELKEMYNSTNIQAGGYGKTDYWKSLAPIRIRIDEDGEVYAIFELKNMRFSIID